MTEHARGQEFGIGAHGKCVRVAKTGCVCTFFRRSSFQSKWLILFASLASLLSCFVLPRLLSSSFSVSLSLTLFLSCFLPLFVPLRSCHPGLGGRFIPTPLQHTGHTRTHNTSTHETASSWSPRPSSSSWNEDQARFGWRVLLTGTTTPTTRKDTTDTRRYGLCIPDTASSRASTLKSSLFCGLAPEDTCPWYGQRHPPTWNTREQRGIRPDPLERTV